MNEQLDLVPKDGEAHARSTDPGTSHEAASAVEGTVASRLELKVYETLRHFPTGLTTHELVEWSDIPYESVTPRIRPLIRKGMVYDSGEKRLHGRRNCIVWKAVVK